MTPHHPSVAGEGPPESAISVQLARIQASPRFIKAPRLCQLLAYLVEHSTSGNSRDLLEFSIGIEVFGRGPEFDPQSDTIVRVTVHRLRRVLADYYGNEGASDPVRFTIPAGHYRVEFSVQDPPAKYRNRVQRGNRAIRLVLATAAVVLLASVALAGLVGLSEISSIRGVASEPAAIQDILLGEQLLHRRGPGDLEQAVRRFEAAVSEDPGNANAWTGLAWSLSLLTYREPDKHGDLVPRQYAALQQALALDPSLPEANARMAKLLCYVGDRAGAVRYMKRALRSGADSNVVLSIIAGEERAGGDLAGAMELQRKANDSAPLDVASVHNLAYMQYEARDFDHALMNFHRAEQISPLSASAKAGIVKALLLKGELRKAERELDQIGDGKEKQQAKALLYTAAGRREESRLAWQALAAEPSSFDVQFMLAEVHAFRGEYDMAMGAIEAAYARIVRDDTRPSFNCQRIQMILMSPYIARLAGQPRYETWAETAHAYVDEARPNLMTMAALERVTASP